MQEALLLAVSELVGERFVRFRRVWGIFARYRVQCSKTSTAKYGRNLIQRDEIATIVFSKRFCQVYWRFLYVRTQPFVIVPQ